MTVESLWYFEGGGFGIIVCCLQLFGFCGALGKMVMKKNGLIDALYRRGLTARRRFSIPVMQEN